MTSPKKPTYPTFDPTKRRAEFTAWLRSQCLFHADAPEFILRKQQVVYEAIKLQTERG